MSFSASPVASVLKVSTDTNAIITSAIDTTGADFLVALVGYFNGVNAPGSVTDSKGNSWTALTAYLCAGTTQFGQLWYCKNPIVGSGHTFSFGAAVTYPCIFVEAWSGADLTSPFDLETGTASIAGDPTAQPGNLTPSVNNCLVIAAVIYPQADISDVASVDSSFTLGGHNTSGILTNLGGGIAYQVQTTATLRNPAFTAATGAPRAAAMIASFKSAGAAAATVKQLAALGVG